MRFSKLAASLVVSGLGGSRARVWRLRRRHRREHAASRSGLRAPGCVQARPTPIASRSSTTPGRRSSACACRRSLINKPAALAPTTFVGGVVTGGVSLAQTECYLNGTGTFSWLLYFDTATNTVCTGGAKPSADPLGQGFCFVNGQETVGGKTFDIKPIKFDSDLTTNTFEVVTGQDIIVPVYSDTGLVLLPLKKARIVDGKLSADHNCVGNFNAEKLDPFNNCYANPKAEPPEYSFVSDGKIEGYITLEEADSVVVSTAHASLCVSCSGGTSDNGTPDAHCTRDANMKIQFKGDWCDATNAAADASCADSVALGADFAASAVKISGGCPIP